MTMSIWIVLLLAVVQGLTEFFPVSSSGHLVMFEALFGGRGDASAGSVLFEVAVHVGTLGAIVVFYRRKLRALLVATLAVLGSGRKGWEAHRGEARYIGYIVAGTIPAALAGVLLRDEIAGAFDAPALASAFLVATGAFLLLGRRRAVSRTLSWRTALVIGAAQAVAILPGISRSGWTITTALILGLGFAEAAEFSFLLSIPAILGALVLEIAAEPPAMTVEALLPLVVGAAAAFLSGWLALRLLIGVLTRGAFHRFAYYLFPVGFAALYYFAR
jgi:undecaprenyl-diphosphatase